MGRWSGSISRACGYGSGSTSYLGEFSWNDLVRASWDEGQNCSHYFNSLHGTNDFAKKIVAQLIALEQKYDRNFTCPSRLNLCLSAADAYAKERGLVQRDVLISPQCLELQDRRKTQISFLPEDSRLDRQGLDAKGFYSGETIVEKVKAWCTEQRDLFFKSRCQKSIGKTVSECPKDFEKVTVEKFRCEFDTRDFLGWAT